MRCSPLILKKKKRENHNLLMHGPSHSREREENMPGMLRAQSSLTVCLVFQVARQFFPENPSICVKRVFFFFFKKEKLFDEDWSPLEKKVSDNIIRLFSHAVFSFFLLSKC